MTSPMKRWKTQEWTIFAMYLLNIGGLMHLTKKIIFAIVIPNWRSGTLIFSNFFLVFIITVFIMKVFPEMFKASDKKD